MPKKKMTSKKKTTKKPATKKPTAPKVTAKVTKDPKISAVICPSCNGVLVPEGHQRKAVRLICSQCGTKVPVNAPIVKVVVSKQCLAKAMKNLTLPLAIAPTKARETKYDRRLVVTCTSEQHNQFMRAFMACRQLNDVKDEDRSWLGQVLELICADFLSGVPSDILTDVDKVLGEMQNKEDKRQKKMKFGEDNGKEKEKQK